MDNRAKCNNTNYKTSRRKNWSKSQLHWVRQCFLDTTPKRQKQLKKKKKMNWTLLNKKVLCVK